MANKPLQSIKFPGLSDTYTTPQVDATLTTTGAAADAKKTGDEITSIKQDLLELEDAVTEEVKSKNMIDPDTVVVGQLNSSGNVNSTKTSYKTSDFIYLEGGKSYIFAREWLDSAEGYVMGYSGYGIFDTSKTWIEDSLVWGNNGNTGLVITPENDCYVRLCGGKDYFTDDTTALFILQEGTTLDGYEPYFAPYQVLTVVKKEDIVQQSGQGTDKIMSQKAVTDLINSAVPEKMDDIVDAFYIQVGKNKYNQNVCVPQDGCYYSTSNSGTIETAASYAITGKIPCEAQKTYTFSAGGVTVYKAFYFGGETGDTYLGASDSGTSGNPLTITTPENCTYVGFNIFATNHTTEQYDAAIASGQLELGTTATIYEAYTETVILSTDNVQNGESLEAINDITELQSQVNLYDKTLAVNGKYINSGAVASNANWAYTGRIPVEPNAQYCLSIDVDAPLGLSTAATGYAQDGTFLGSGTEKVSGYSYLITIITSPNTYFITVNMSKTDHTEQEFNDTIDTLILCKGTNRPLTYTPYSKVPVVKSSSIDNAYQENVNCFTGKKWLAIGTSITWYDGKKYQAGLNTEKICRGYVGNVSSRKRLLVTNEGISGSTLGNISASSLINRYQTLDWEHTDIATIEFGVNDFGQAVDIGTADDAPGTDTFAACLKTVIEYALAQNPKLCLVICTEPDVRGTTANTGGHYLYEYTDVTIAIAKQYRLPVCDWFYHSGINAVTKGSSSVDYLTADGTHPNDAGHLRMGAMLNQVFDSLIC